tara:strand:+ start:4108 stop:4929 length:822 start_codon:yes stop_codon:yes gene_type:complete
MNYNKNNIVLISIIVCCIPSSLFAQGGLASKNIKESVALVGGTLHIGTGKIIPNAIIGFKNGKISIVEKAETVQIDSSEYNIIDLSGQHIYPGFILLNSLIGIEEISGVPHTNDILEQGRINPSLNTAYAFNSDSEFLPVLRFNDILTVETDPIGGMISRSSSVMKLDGRNWEESLYKFGAGIHLNWPNSTKTSYDTATNTRQINPDKNYNTNVAELKGIFTQAIAYGKLDGKKPNLKLETVQGLFNGTKHCLSMPMNQRKLLKVFKLQKRWE